MKVDIAKYVAECDTCHRMKASHLKSAGVLQPLSIPMWKWDDISMDFIVGLPLMARRKDSIWVIVDKLTKTAHFIEHPLGVLDRKERKPRRQTVRMYKIQWSHHMEEEATWETEDYFNTKYPDFLQSRNCESFSPPFRYLIKSRDEILLRG
jgi:hypothetical protein